MEFLDARRLTGPSLIFDGPGAILDVSCSAEEADRLIPVWQANVQRMLAELGWGEAELSSQKLVGGVSMAFPAPIDALYAASEINEWAWAASAHELGEDIELPDFEETAITLRASAAEEANPQLMRLIDQQYLQTPFYGVRRMTAQLQRLGHEVNVKRVELSQEIDAYASFGLKVNSKALGPRLGKAMKDVIKASKQGEWTTRDDGGIEVAGEVLEEGEFSLTLRPKDGVACQALPGNDAIVVLDLKLTPELVQEGMARDLVRVVQQARKEAGLHVTDRIRLVVPVVGEWREAVEAFRDYVGEQTLATQIEIGTGTVDGLFRYPVKLGGGDVEIALGLES